MDQPRPEPAPDSAEARAHDLLGVGFLIGDGTRILHANDAAARILARSTEELVGGDPVRSYLHAEDEQRIAATIAERTEQGRRIPERFNARLLQPDGTHIPVELWVKAEIRGDQVRTYTLIHEVGELWALSEELTQLALTDPLTQLPNRLAFEEHLKMALARMEHSPQRGILLFLDLDGLKQLNDLLGHGAGDAALQEFATRLVGSLRASDTAARIGGDEFIALIPAADPGDPEAVLARVRDATTFEFVSGDHRVTVRTSVGAVVFDDPHATPSELIALADTRMYRAKRAKLGLD